jgi:hypothetical protein
MVCHQEAAKTLNFEDISLRPRYNLRCSLAFQTTSKWVFESQGEAVSIRLRVFHLGTFKI